MSNECEFGHGPCIHGIDEHCDSCNRALRTEQMVVFREAYCNPCIESRKVFELAAIQREVSWMREILSEK